MPSAAKKLRQGAGTQQTFSEESQEGNGTFLGTYQGAILIFLILIASFAVLKFAFLGQRFSDGHVYTYMGYLIAKGFVPYRDFYYSSPPFLPYALATIGTIWGWKSQIFDMMPILLAVLDSFMLFGVAWRRSSPWGGVSAALLYLSSYSVLATTDFSSDVHWIVTFLIAGWFAYSFQKMTLGRILLSLTLLVKVYALVLVAGIAIQLFFENRRRESLMLLATAIGTFTIVIGIFYCAAGPIAIEDIIIKNLGRRPGIPTANILQFFFAHDLWIFLATPWLIFRAFKKEGEWINLTPIALYVAFFMAYQDVYYLYLKPLVALAAMAFIATDIDHSAKGRLGRMLFLSLLLIIAMQAAWTYGNEQGNAAKISGLSDMVEVTEALTAPGEPIYGESTVTPLIALLADRPIYKNYVDNNPKFLATGVFSLESRAQEIEADRVKLIITKGNVEQNHLLSVSETLPTQLLLSRCEPAKIFPIPADYAENAVILWSCFQGPKR